MGFFPVAVSGGCSLDEVWGLLTVGAAPVAEQGLWGAWASAAAAPGSRAPAQ